MSMDEMNKLKINDIITNVICQKYHQSLCNSTWSIKNIQFLKLDTLEHLGCYIVYLKLYYKS